MSVRLKNGKWIAEAYDPLTQRKRHVGSFESREDAEKASASVAKYKVKSCVECGERFRPRTANQIRCKRTCKAETPTKLRATREHVAHWLYRIFDRNDELLYVGITNSGTRRLGQHASVQPWAGEVSYIKIEHFEDRETALLGEELAIRREKPLHNRTYRQPEQRIVKLADYREAREAP